MKRFLSLLFVLALLPCLILSVSASELPLVIDDAGLMSGEEVAALEEMAASLQKQYNMDFIVLTVDSMNGMYAQDYADNYYDSQGYSDDGVIFLLAMGEREWYISTCGDAIYALTDYGIQQLGETVVWYLSEGWYYDGFVTYLDSLPAYLNSYESGSPVDGYADDSGDYYHGDREEVVYYEQNTSPNIFLSLLIGAGVAAAVVLSMRASMNTKRAQRGASGYLKANSFHLRSHQDLFLYSNVSRTPRPQNNGSHPGGRPGGGSSVHRSSSGRRHGGGGGRF